VSAVVQLADGADLGVDDLVAACRDQLAGYKVPKDVVFVDQVQRSPAGKADYRWAKATATSTTS
jgi:acyl-CoA synthetase (AMP-forming)/AMP-acid ligase II